MRHENKQRTTRTCRTCLEESVRLDELISLFSNMRGSRNVSKDVFEEIRAFNLGITEDDGLPQQICLKCEEAFSSISHFKRQCLEVQAKLAEAASQFNEDMEAATCPERCISFEVIIINSEEEEKARLASEGTDETSESGVYCYQLYESDLNELDVADDGDDENRGVLPGKEGNAGEPLRTPTPSTLNANRSADHSYSANEVAEYQSNAANSNTSTTSSNSEEHLDQCLTPRRSFDCPICQRKFSSASNRNSHLQLHNKNDAYPCDVCNLRFKSKMYAAKHKRAVHETGEYECRVCSQKLRNAIKFKYHMRSHNPVKKFKCTYCDRSFMQHHHLVNHERTHTGQRPFLCNICGNGFKQETNLKMHLRMHSGERPYSCTICGKDFIQRGAYVMHMRHHNNIRPYQCEVCGKKFIQMSTLTVHLRTHTGERPYKCSFCGKAFAQTHQLKYHKYSSHNGSAVVDKTLLVDVEKQMPDDSDGKRNSWPEEKDQGGLNQHLYVCPICSRGFKLPSSLTSHVKCHSEERKHVCKECGNTFKRAEHLRIHVNGVHLKKKPYACDYCDKTFSQIGDRNIHLKSHTVDKPHHCRFCNKGFKLQKSLRAHERIHTGEKPFTCEICESDFISYNALAIHTMKHSDEERTTIKDKTLLSLKEATNQNGSTTYPVVETVQVEHQLVTDAETCRQEVFKIPTSKVANKLQ